MKILKIESNETLSREQAAARLHEIADHLASHNDIEMEWSGKHLRLRVPDEVRVELEIEIEDDETEFEIELKWRHTD
jgi:amphi-Trp domain-containing protein